MAIKRLPATANQSKPVVGSAEHEPVDRLLKGGLLGHLAVQGVAFRIEMLVAPRPPAKRHAEEHVFDAVCVHASAQLIAAEMRRETRVRIGPHIDDVDDVVALQQRHERLEVMVGMPNSPQNGRRQHRNRMLRPPPDDSIRGAIAVPRAPR